MSVYLLYHILLLYYLFSTVCLADRKVFLQEQKLYAPKGINILFASICTYVYLFSDLERHMKHGDKEEKIQHEMCSFCVKYFYDKDKLCDHLHHKHEQCFLC